MTQTVRHLGFILGSMVLLQLFTTMALNSPSVLGPVIVRDLQVSPGLIGVAASIVAVAGMFASLFAGRVVLRLGVIRASQAGALLMCVGLVLAALHVPALLFVAAALLGLGVGPITPASSQLLARVTPPHRLGLAFSIRQSGIPAGVGLMGILYPALLAHMRWPGVPWVMAAIIAALALALQPLRRLVDPPVAVSNIVSAALPGGPHATAPVQSALAALAALLQPLRMLWGHATLRNLALCVMLYTVVQTVLLTYLVSYLTLELHYSLATAGALFSLVQLMAVTSRVLWGWVADRLRDPMRVLGLLGVAAAVCLALLGAMGESWPFSLVAVLVALCGATVSGWNGLHFAAIAQLLPAASVGTATGAMQVFAYLGGVIGPPVFALIMAATGRLSTAYFAFAGFMLVVAVIVLLRLRGGAPTAAEALR